MNQRTTTLHLVHQYKELQDKFIALCTVLIEQLPPGNDYGIEIGSGDRISRNISILDHPCRIVFNLRMAPEPVIGKVTFQRVLAQDRTANFFTAYFDRLGNATEKPDESFSYSINGINITNWLTIRVLEEFLKSLSIQEQ